jgi:penicillin-binding protein 1B
VRVHLHKKSKFVRILLHPAGKAFLIVLALVVITGLSVFTYYYVKYARLIEAKLTTGPFANTSALYAAPETIMVGEEISADEIVSRLRRSGYSESRNPRMGWYNVKPDGVEIFPGPMSLYDTQDAVIKLKGKKISKIISVRDGEERTSYDLEPELITNLFDRNREKRRIVTFEDLPQVLVDAVVSAEDKRFFQHSGFDPRRIAKAVYEDVKAGYKAQGASTLSMQLARMFWLYQDKTWKRKAAEVLITFHLENKLSKKEIFTYYANQIDLGRRGSFSIHGFGEAAQAYFGKDVRQLSLAEAATIAGLIQRPSFTNPIRWPDRARQRRNVVLSMMRENGCISDRDYAVAAASPLVVAKGGGESTDAPYFVDLVNDELQDAFAEHDFQSKNYRVYTTLDLNLQREAVESVRVGIAEVDELLRRRRRKNPALPEAQVALVALDAQTGEVKALLGGRNYGMSQLNRALAKRQPGSVFKPFVYSAALSTALYDSPKVLTPLTTVLDQPTTFWFDNKSYEPGNFKDEYHGVVTLRQAITKSMNIPTVKIAETVGYDTVAELARKAGMNVNLRPTPAIALGAYEVTPIEIAGSYTIFPNRGSYVKPTWIKHIGDSKGQPVFTQKIVRKPVLDPRVAFLMVDLMEDVLRTGTGAGTRSRGFTLPAAGKTGTSRDGWFAGFTSKLICVVWVGFDDNTELGLEGAKSALPIWTEFMKRAHKYREYRAVKEFEAPEGVVSVLVDPQSGELASPACPGARPEEFIAGTQPVVMCQLHGGGHPQIAGWEATERPTEIAAAPPRAPAPPRLSEPGASSVPEPPVRVGSKTVEPEIPKKKKGFWGTIREIFK